MSKDTPVMRRFSLEDDFMNYKTDDLLFAFMRTLSTATPIDKSQTKFEEYLPVKSFKKQKSTIAKVLNVSTRTLNRHIEDMIAAGLIKEAHRGGGDCYLFPYDEKGKYKLVEKDMLEYLIDTRSPNAIRVYLFLLDKFDWKAKTKEHYKFTIKEMRMAFGYSENSKLADTTFTNIVESLAREGIISYQEVYDKSMGNKHVIPRKVLMNVIKHKKDLKKV